MRTNILSNAVDQLAIREPVGEVLATNQVPPVRLPPAATAIRPVDASVDGLSTTLSNFPARAPDTN